MVSPYSLYSACVVCPGTGELVVQHVVPLTAAAITATVSAGLASTPAATTHGNSVLAN